MGNPTAEAHRVISADPDAWYKPTTQRELMGEESWADYYRSIHDPATVFAMCEDYRAGLGIDRAHDDDDQKAGRRVQCPTLVVWAGRDDMEDLYGDVLGVWSGWADNLTGRRIDSGHHIAEEAPEALVDELRAFLR